MGKKIAIGLVAVILVLGVGGYLLFSNLGGVIKAVVESEGPKVTQTSVALGSVDLDLAAQKAGLSNLVIGNPKGFDTDYAVKMGSIAVVLADVSSELVHISSVTIDGPAIIYELGDGGSNIDKIQQAVNSFAGSAAGSSSGASAEKPAAQDAGESIKMIIDHLYITNAEAAVSAPFLKGDSLGTKLPDVHLQDIGRKSDGATPGEVASAVLSALNKSIASGVSKLDLGGLAAQGQKLLEGAASEGSTQAGKLLEQGAGAAEQAGSSVKKLFGN